MVQYAPMKPLATDTHDFPSIRKAGKIYVDKTMFMHRLVANPNSRLFFLIRCIMVKNMMT